MDPPARSLRGGAALESSIREARTHEHPDGARPAGLSGGEVLVSIAIQVSGHDGRGDAFRPQKSSLRITGERPVPSIAEQRYGAASAGQGEAGGVGCRQVQAPIPIQVGGGERVGARRDALARHVDLDQVDSGGENYTTPNDILDTVIKAAAPTLSATNKAQWRVVYSKVVRNGNSCNPGDPCEYIVDQDADGRFVRGNLNKQSKLGPQDGTPIPQSVLPGIQNIKDSQTFHVFEIFYDYAPNIITFVGNGINTDFYDRTMFTDVSGT